MVGMNRNLFYNIDINVPGLEKLDQLKQKIMQNSRVANQVSGSLNRMTGETKKAGNAADEGGRAFGKMFGLGMNVMFLGMALQQVFGRLAKSVLEMTGATTALGTAMKTALLPFFIEVTPVILRLSQAIMNLPKPIKMVFGALVLLLAIAGPLIFFGAQLFLLTTQLTISFTTLLGIIGAFLTVFTALGLGIILVIRAFKKFGAVLGTLAAVAVGAVITKLMFMTSVGKLLSLALFKLTGSTAALTTSMYGLELSLSSILLTVGSLALAIITLRRVFKKFGPVVGLIATIIGGTLLAAVSPVAGAVLAIYGAFKAVHKIFKKFGKTVGWMAGLIVQVVGILLAIFFSVPVGIGLAIGATLAILWNFKEEIRAVITGAIDLFKKLLSGVGSALSDIGSAIKDFIDSAVKFLKKLPKKTKEFVGGMIDFLLRLPAKILKLTKDMVDAGIEFGKSLIDGVVEGINEIGGDIADAFFDFLPGPLSKAVKGVSRFSGGLIDRIQGVLRPNDFILTSDGKMIKPHKNDTIIGTKNPENLGGGGNGDVTVNINDPVMKEDVDVQRLVDEVEDRVNRDTRGRSGGLTR